MATDLLIVEESSVIVTGKAALDNSAAAAVAASAKTIFDHAAKLGFKPKTGDRDVHQIKRTFRASRPVKDPGGSSTVQTVSFDLVIQNFGKAGSKDEVAVAMLNITAPGQTINDARLLTSVGGDRNNYKEEMVDAQGKVVETQSWWTCTRDGVLRDCGGPCLAAIIGCSGTWVAYLFCLAIRCGGCAAGKAVCCACDCRWWCRWATGCCDA